MFLSAYLPTNYYYKKKSSPVMINKNTNHLSFERSFVTKKEQAELVAKLTEKMKNKNENTKKLYQYGIDYITQKSDKKEYLNKMYNLLQNTKGSQWGLLNEGESRYIGNYGVFFNLCGTDAKNTTRSTILDFFEYLIDN